MVMLSKWKRKILLDRLHGLEVKPSSLRVVKSKVKKHIIEAFRDI